MYQILKILRCICLLLKISKLPSPLLFRFNVFHHVKEKRERERENESCNWDLQIQQREERLLLLQGLAMVKSDTMTQQINQYTLTGFDDEELLKHLRGLSGDQVGRYSS